MEKTTVELREMFAKAYPSGKDFFQEYFGRSYEESRTYREAYGIKLFKRKIMGLFGRKTTKSVDELVQNLQELHIVASKEEGKELTAKLDGQELEYGFGRNSYYGLKFTKVDQEGKDIYLIEREFYRDFPTPFSDI